MREGNTSAISAPTGHYHANNLTQKAHPPDGRCGPALGALSDWRGWPGSGGPGQPKGHAERASPDVRFVPRH